MNGWCLLDSIISVTEHMLGSSLDCRCSQLQVYDSPGCLGLVPGQTPLRWALPSRSASWAGSWLNSEAQETSKARTSPSQMPVQPSSKYSDCSPAFYFKKKRKNPYLFILSFIVPFHKYRIFPVL